MPVSSSKPYGKKVIPTSDSRVREYEDTGTEEIFHVWICKVCRKQFAERENKVVCDDCKNYCHAEHSSKYEMKVYDHLCLAEKLGVNKQSFMVLYGIKSGLKRSDIRDRLNLSFDEFDFVLQDLRKAGLIRRRWFFSDDITYKAHEALPVLEAIYKEESDFIEFKGDGMTEKASSSPKPRPSIPRVSASKIMFAIVAFGILAIMLTVMSSALSFMRAYYLPGSVIVIVWILLLLLTAYIIYKVKGLFG